MIEKGGKGFLLILNDSYEGDLKNAKPHGEGEYKNWQSKSIYRGSFEYGLKNGKGILL